MGAFWTGNVDEQVLGCPRLERSWLEGAVFQSSPKEDGGLVLLGFSFEKPNRTKETFFCDKALASMFIT